jgi:hypothetical protein
MEQRFTLQSGRVALRRITCRAVRSSRWFGESGRFAPTIHQSYAWRRAHDGASYTDWLRTRSDHRLIPAAQLEEVLQDAANAIAARGDRCDLLYETHLYMARLIAN